MVEEKKHSEIHAPMVRLLDAMAREWPSFVQDLARLGEAVSEPGTKSNASHVRELQAFDTLGQLAQAHGALLAHIARELSQGSASPELEGSIARIPFLEMRQRLHAALKGHETVAARNKRASDELEPDNEGAVCWL
jgi:hypothetical protein